MGQSEVKDGDVRHAYSCRPQSDYRYTLLQTLNVRIKGDRLHVKLSSYFRNKIITPARACSLIKFHSSLPSCFLTNPPPILFSDESSTPIRFLFHTISRDLNKNTN